MDEHLNLYTYQVTIVVDKDITNTFLIPSWISISIKWKPVKFSSGIWNKLTNVVWKGLSQGIRNTRELFLPTE